MESLSTSITVNAPATKVWKALTDTEIVKQYFFGTTQKSDWKKGSKITWKGEWEGKTYEDHGEILDIDPGKSVNYTYWSSMSGTEDKPENYAMVGYHLDEKDSITVLTVTQDKIKNAEAKNHSEQNWQMIFGKMKEMVESGKV